LIREEKEKLGFLRDYLIWWK